MFYTLIKVYHVPWIWELRPVRGSGVANINMRPKPKHSKHNLHTMSSQLFQFNLSLSSLFIILIWPLHRHLNRRVCLRSIALNGIDSIEPRRPSMVSNANDGP